MRVIAEAVEPENCKDCAYILTGTPHGGEGEVYACPLMGLTEVSGEGIDSGCPWTHLEDDEVLEVE